MAYVTITISNGAGLDIEIAEGAEEIQEIGGPSESLVPVTALVASAAKRALSAWYAEVPS